MTRILGPASKNIQTVRENLTRLGANALFLQDIFPAVWAAATRYNVDPVGAVAQAAKETGYGKFPGLLTAEWKNTCGLKIPNPGKMGFTGDTDREPFAHQIFASWNIGALAHVQHLVAYAGGSVGESDRFELVDGRFGLIAGKYRCVEFADLTGKWATDPGYGAGLEAVILELQKPSNAGG